MFVKIKAFADADNFRFRGTGISGSVEAGESGNVQHKLTEERYINGVRPVLKNHEFGDSMHFDIVDVDNILGYGAGVVLDRFADDWYVNPDMACQGDILIDYPAKVMAGLYIRVVYHSTGTEDVEVKVNLYLHKKT